MSGRAKSTSVVHAAKILLSEAVDARSARQVAEALEVWRDRINARQAALAVADTLEALYAGIGVPTRLRQLHIAREDLRHIANETVKNFNANAGMRLPQDQIDDAMRLLEAAYWSLTPQTTQALHPAQSPAFLNLRRRDRPSKHTAQLLGRLQRKLDRRSGAWPNQGGVSLTASRCDSPTTASLSGVTGPGTAAKPGASYTSARSDRGSPVTQLERG